MRDQVIMKFENVLKTAARAHGEFERRWSDDPNATRFELPTIGVNKMLAERCVTRPQTNLTRSMIWDMECKKTLDPSTCVSSRSPAACRSPAISAPLRSQWCAGQSQRSRNFSAPAEASDSSQTEQLKSVLALDQDSASHLLAGLLGASL